MYLVIVLGVLLIAVGAYALHLRHALVTQREAAERAVRQVEAESDRTPGQPTNLDARPSRVNRPRFTR